MLEVTLLVDSHAADPELQVEHGLSFLVQCDGEVILFDTGASGAWLANARHLGLPVERIGHLVLSHGHRDHTGGVAELLELIPEVEVCMHPRALVPRCSRHPGLAPRPLGFPARSWQALAPRADRIRWSTAPMALAPGIGVSGPIPRRHPQELHSGPFFLDTHGQTEDLLEDDQALWIRTPEGLVVVLGCTHAGLANTLDHLRELTGERRIRAVLGGLHLAKADPERLAFTAARLQEAAPGEILACHCSGEAAALALGCRWMAAGETWVI
nr:MBL fold metallo-hydrolase [uncultured Holophaga sp.]